MICHPIDVICRCQVTEVHARKIANHHDRIRELLLCLISRDPGFHTVNLFFNSLNSIRKNDFLPITVVIGLRKLRTDLRHNIILRVLATGDRRIVANRRRAIGDEMDSQTTVADGKRNRQSVLSSTGSIIVRGGRHDCGFHPLVEITASSEYGHIEAVRIYRRVQPHCLGLGASVRHRHTEVDLHTLALRSIGWHHPRLFQQVAACKQRGKKYVANSFHLLLFYYCTPFLISPSPNGYTGPFVGGV